MLYIRSILVAGLIKCKKRDVRDTVTRDYNRIKGQSAQGNLQQSLGLIGLNPPAR